MSDPSQPGASSPDADDAPDGPPARRAAGWRHLSGPDGLDDETAATPGDGRSSDGAAGSDEPVETADDESSRSTVGRRRRPARVQVEDKTPRRRAGLVLGIVTVALVIIAAGGGWVVNRLNPATEVTQTVTASPTVASWPLMLPVTIGEYSRNANEGATPTTGPDGKKTVSARYAKNGKDAAVILLSRPQTDGKAFMEEANMNALGEVEPGWCGVSGDNDLDACAIIRDGTAVLVMAVADMSRTELMALAVATADQIDG